MSPSARIARAVLTCTALLAAGCSSLPAARLQLPAGLATPVQDVALPWRGGRSGSIALPAALGGGAVSFERQADRWSALGLVQGDRAALRWQWQPDSGPAQAWSCSLRRTELTPGVLQAPLGTPRWRCQGPEGAELQLEERVRSTQREHQGHYQRGSLRLELASLHRLQGSPFGLAEPGGYAIARDGSTVAVVDLLGGAAVLRAPAAALGDPALGPALRDLSLLLGLAWDPARP